MAVISGQDLHNTAYTLLAKAATQYPKNYLDKMVDHLRRETNPGAKGVMASILYNILYAAEEPASLCQDTGIPRFHLYLNPGISIDGDIERALTEATIRATEEVPIRKNVVDPLTYENPGTNTGWGVPFVHFHYDATPGPLRIRAELKGFGGEIKSISDWIFTSAGSMEDAVLAYVLNSVIMSKGENCTPGFLGVGVGGYASEAAVNAQNALYRDLSESGGGSPDGSIRRLEERIYRCVNRLGLGPMGGGGDTTTLGVYVERRGTHTAASSVTLCQQCWASRGSEALITEHGASYITPHLETSGLPALIDLLDRELSQGSSGTVYRFNTPVATDDLRKLRVGDVVYLNGTVCTARDGAHRRMADLVRSGAKDTIPPAITKNGAIYHCGPVIGRTPDGWCINAAGPTTSSRFTDDAAFLVEEGVFNLAVGKGTMGTAMVKALRNRGVFLQAVGGCAVSYKRAIAGNDVAWIDLGYPEAVWMFEVHDFGPLVVGIDSHGNSLATATMEQVYENARRLYRDEGLDPEKRYVQYPLSFPGLSLEELIEKMRSD